MGLLYFYLQTVVSNKNCIHAGNKNILNLVAIQFRTFQRFICYTKFGTKEIEPIVITVIIIIHAAVVTFETISKNAEFFLCEPSRVVIIRSSIHYSV
jgi:hypothetical protein